MGSPKEIAIIVFLNILKMWIFIYECLTYPFYFFVQDKDSRMLKVTAMPVKSNDPFSAWRNVKSLNQMSSTPIPGCETFVDLWNRARSLYPYRDILGTRETLSSELETQSNGKQFLKLVRGRYHWESYEDVDERVNNLAAGMLSLGLIPGKDKIVIFAETRSEWIIVTLAAFKANIIVTTLYATLGEDAIVHGINESEAPLIFTSDELIMKLCTALHRCNLIKNVAFMDAKLFKDKNGQQMLDLKNKCKEKLPSEVVIMELSRLEEIGEEYGSDILSKIKSKATKESLAVIMYTSGSTGVPKGVEITHGNIVAAMAGFYDSLPPLNWEEETYVSYLPLAHVLELICELLMLSLGVKLGYSSALTLTDTASKIKKRTKGDVGELRPTILVSVPTILERVNKAVWTEVRKQGDFFTALFNWQCEYKKSRLGRGYPSVFLDKFVFERLRKMLGGKVKYMISGGAPLSEDAQNFVNICFCPVLQGYGLTETCGGGTVMSYHDLRTGMAGTPITCLQMKLREWQEGGYSPSDKPNPRGEVLISGGNVTKGYYKQPEKTDEAFFTDEKGVRWFCTGDIGMFSPDGTLSIIDRKKDLVKLQGGEYVSLGKVELAISQCTIVENACVYADSLEEFTVCLISTRRRPLVELAKKHGVDCSEEFEALCRNEKIIAMVVKDIQRICMEKKIERFEIPQKVYLDPTAWTPDSGMVTDALKLKRREIQIRYQNEIDRMYNRPRK